MDDFDREESETMGEAIADCTDNLVNILILCFYIICFGGAIGLAVKAYKWVVAL